MAFTKEVIEPLQAAMMAEYEKNKDSTDYTKNYTTDCKVIMSKQDREFCGHEGVKDMMKIFAEFDKALGKHDYKMEQTGIHPIGDDMGWTEGTFSVILEDGKVAHRGRYLAIWKKVDGKWKIHRDISNEC